MFYFDDVYVACLYRSVARLLVEAKPEFKVSNEKMDDVVIRAGNSATVELPYHGGHQTKPHWKVCIVIPSLPPPSPPDRSSIVRIDIIRVI